jgi:hypothetical protein
MAVRPYSTTRPKERTAALSNVGTVQPFLTSSVNKQHYPPCNAYDVNISRLT